MLQLSGLPQQLGTVWFGEVFWLTTGCQVIYGVVIKVRDVETTNGPVDRWVRAHDAVRWKRGCGKRRRDGT